MKKILLMVCLFLGSSLYFTTLSWAETMVFVHQDTSKLVKLPEMPSSIIIGNPAIAGVTLHDGHTLIISGRTFGQTNVFTLDENGTVLDNLRVVTQQRFRDRLTVQLGSNRTTYSCTPHCNLVPQLGDSDSARIIAQEQLITNRGERSLKEADLEREVSSGSAANNSFGSEP